MWVRNRSGESARPWIAANGFWCGSCVVLTWLVGCTTSHPDQEDNAAEARQELTASGSSIIGFENPSNWTLTQGSIPAPQRSTTHTQGSFSLALKAQNFVVVKSAAFGVTNAVSGPLAFDLFLPQAQPNPAWFGAAQLYLDCPSKSIFNAFIGQQELTGLPTNQFDTLRFALPAALASSLVNGCGDLDFRISLNVPSNATGTYLLDNLRFRGSEGDIAPTVDCVAKLSSTKYRAFFGYVSHENFSVSIPAGPDNALSPSSPTSGPPTIFEPGTQRDAVTVDFSPSGTASWHLPSGTATATAGTPVCPGSAPTHVTCDGIPATTAAGCAIVVKVPNATGPGRDDPTLGLPLDPADVPAGSTDEEDVNEAAIPETQFDPPTVVVIAANTSKTVSVSLTETTRVFAKAQWLTPATFKLSLTQGSNVATGTPVNLGSFGGAVQTLGFFQSGTVQVQVQNTGTQSATVTLKIGRLPNSLVQ